MSLGCTRAAWLLAASLGMAGCGSFGRLAEDPAVAAAPTLGLTEADRFDFGGADAPPQPDEADLRWWQRFNDPELAAWVERALAGNVDVAVAAERVQQAQALLQVSRAQRGPRLGLQADAELRLRRDAGDRRVQPGAALALDFDTDLWGGLRQAERSAAAGVLASQDRVQAARLAAAGLAARAYVEWRAALQDRRLLADALALQREALHVVTVRVEAGLAPVLDRERAIAEVAAIEAELAASPQRIAGAAAALQVLAGERPQPGRLAADEAGAIPALQGVQPMARPADLLRLRPDLRAAEQDLLAAVADIGVAQSALRPRLRLPGSLVFGAVSGGSAIELATATLAAVLDLTLFDAGAASAGVDAARSRAREASLVYRRTLLQALQQVEAAGAAGQGARARIAARERGSVAARAAEAQAQVLYRAGLTGFIDVLDAQRSALANQRELLQARADAASTSVSAFEAMGLIDGPGH